VLNVLSAPEFDLSGYVELLVLDEASFLKAERRVNRVRTLDGGAVINDGGFSDADRTIVLRWRTTSAAHDAAVERMVRLYELVNVSTRSGVFAAAPERFDPGDDESSLSLLVLSKLST
jgi:ferric-dicitrate binding protein FerR (iron transport regulator)